MEIISLEIQYSTAMLMIHVAVAADQGTRLVSISCRVVAWRLASTFLFNLLSWSHDSISCFVLNFQITNICFIMRGTWKWKAS